MLSDIQNSDQQFYLLPERRLVIMFNSVFNDLTDVRNAIQSGRINSENIIVRVDKSSLGVFLSEENEYFNGYESDDYYLSPDTEAEKQVLFHDNFGRPEELCVELLQEFLNGENYRSVNFRGCEDSTNFIG